MKHLAVRGIVLRVVDYREADRILDILTAEQGLVSASARGARRQKSTLLPTTQFLSFCDFQLFFNNRTGKYAVDAAERVVDFRHVRESIERLICASHLCELMVDGARDDHIESPDLFRLMATSLSALNQPARDPMLVVRVFEFRLMCLLGFAPILDQCVVCGDRLDAGEFRFGLAVCGTVCARPTCNARAGERLPLSAGALSCMRYVRDSELKSLFSFRIERADADLFYRICERFVENQMEKRYTKLNLLSQL